MEGGRGSKPVRHATKVGGALAAGPSVESALAAGGRRAGAGCTAGRSLHRCTVAAETLAISVNNFRSLFLSCPLDTHIALPSTMPPPTASLNPKAPHPKSGGNDRAEDHVGGKPDQQKYNAEQDALTKEIAQVKTKLVSTCTPCFITES